MKIYDKMYSEKKYKADQSVQEIKKYLSTYSEILKQLNEKKFEVEANC